MPREIPRNPQVPYLNAVAIKLLTQLCFRKDNPIEKVDMIFVFSTNIYVQELANILKDLLNKNISSKVFITGGNASKVFSDTSTKTEITECDLLLNEIDLTLYPNIKFYTEKASVDTRTNVTEALKVLDFTSFSRILYIFKSHAAGRGYLTLKKILPNTQLLQKTFNVKYPTAIEEINRENWFKSDFGKERVWGEFLRIKTYGQRGDTEYDEVKDIIENIEELTNI